MKRSAVTRGLLFFAENVKTESIFLHFLSWRMSPQAITI